MIHGYLSVGNFLNNFEFDLKRQFLVGVFWTPCEFLWFHSLTMFVEFFVNLFQEFAVLTLAGNGRLNDLNFDKFSAIAIGPGLGISETSREHVLRLLKLKNPLVLDADALNVLSKEDLSAHPIW